MSRPGHVFMTRHLIVDGWRHTHQRRGTGALQQGVGMVEYTLGWDVAYSLARIGLYGDEGRSIRRPHVRPRYVGEQDNTGDARRRGEVDSAGIWADIKAGPSDG